MSKKTDIKNLLESFTNEWRAADKKKGLIFRNDDLTQIAKEKQAEEIDEKLDNLLQQIKEKIVVIIDEKLERIFGGSNTFNAAYQSRLTNVLQIVGLVGKEMDLRDLKTMIEPFKTDYTALQAIDAAIKAAGINERDEYSNVAVGIEALDERKETHSKLVKFKDSIQRFNTQATIGSQLVLEWLEGTKYLGHDSFLEALDDDLNYKRELDPHYVSWELDYEKEIR